MILASQVLQGSEQAHPLEFEVPVNLPSIFLSSTWKDLTPHRIKVKEKLELAGYHVIWMEQFNSDSRPPLETCLSHLATADLCVVIVGRRYGSCPPNRERSFTHREYEYCRHVKKPVLVFLVAEDHPTFGIGADVGDLEIKLAGFRNVLLRNHTPGWFNSEDDLAGKVPIAVGRELARANVTPEKTIAEQTTSLIEAVSFASAPLIRWPQTLANGRWIERPELAMLQESLTSEKSAITLLLGAPGSGKSALIARLCGIAAEAGMHVIGIKAEFLSSSIQTLDDFTNDLFLPVRIDKCVEICARKKPTLLVIDQLDAVCDLSDLKSGRLNAILELINSCRHLQRVKVVASCREFEFNHDSRVSSMEARRIDLALPTWHPINEELTLAGIEGTSDWPEPFKDVLKVPEFLRQFLLEVRESNEIKIFESYQRLLDSIWNRKVDSTEKRDLIYSLTEMLIESEEHWVPTVRFESRLSVLRLLESQGILKTVGAKAGFCHQTMLEHAKARLFTARSGALSEHILQRQDALYVRPTAWATLAYLREADLQEYRREIETLFGNPIRLHIAFLLIDFLGRQAQPHDFEIVLMAQQLEIPDYRRRVLIAIIGQRKWYEVLRCSHFPIVMSWPETELWPMIPILSHALEFAREDCLAFIDRYLIPDVSKDELTRQVFHDFADWDETSVERICKVIRRSLLVRIWWAEDYANLISADKPALAPRIVATALQRQTMKEVNSLSQPAGEKNPDAGKNIVAIRSSWYELPAVAEAAPVEFLEHIWPLFCKDANDQFGEHSSSVLNHYPGSCSELEPADEPPDHHPVATALRTAVVECARASPQTFHRITKSAWSIERHPVQQLLAVGLTAAAIEIAHVGLKFIQGDPRRLFLRNCWADRSNDHFYSAPLVTALARYLDTDGRQALEGVLLNWTMYRPTVELCDSQREWDRESRRELLLAIPPELRSTALLAEVGDEPTPVLKASRIRGGSVNEVPLLPLEDARSAPDQGIIESLERSKDSDQMETEWVEQKPVRKGSRRAQVQVIENLVEEDPKRGITLLPKLLESGFEGAMASALKKLEKSNLHDEELTELIEDLAKRGAKSESFRSDASYVLYRRCRAREGLTDTICCLVNEWLSGSWTIPERCESKSNSDAEHCSSVLWSSDHLGIFQTDDSFWPLLAVTHGYLMRDPAATDEWLNAVETHLMRDHDDGLWVHYCSEFRFISLGPCDKERGVEIVAAMFEKYPTVLSSAHGVALIANISNYVKSDLLQKWLIELLRSPWPKGKQAFGELLALLAARDEEKDAWAKSMVDDFLKPEMCQGVTESVAVGIGFTAGELWEEPEFRAWAGHVLLQLVPLNTDRIAQAITTVFWARDDFPADSMTEALLKEIAAHPHVLVQRSIVDLVPHLASLLPHCRSTVLSVCLSLVSRDDAKTNEQLGELYSIGPDLVNIAMTLQRFEDTRCRGLDLFETLMRLGLDEAYKCLNEIDLRPVSSKRREPRPRRRRRR